MVRRQKVPANFYPVSRPSIGALEEAYVLDAVRSGMVSSIGPYVSLFEERFAEFAGVAEAVAVTSGTSGLYLALKALGIGSGDEVLVPDLSFVATANAVVMAGAVPVFVDVDPLTLCIDSTQIEGGISSRTRAVIPVHLYGHPADMHAILAVGRRHGLRVIEDAAEAHGAAINGVRVGGFGDCAVFSLYGNKVLTTGEGGIITTNDKSLADRFRKLRGHAAHSEKRYWHDELGFNFCMTNLQAALGCAQLERANELISHRRRVFEAYVAVLGQEPGLKLNRTAPWASNAYWMTCLEIESTGRAGRDFIMSNLMLSGIQTRPFFYPMSSMPHLPKAKTPVAHFVSEQGLCLPTYSDLDISDIAYIAERALSAVAAMRAGF
jgi:perosamine synthetase